MRCMDGKLSLMHVPLVLFRPAEAFAVLGRQDQDTRGVFTRYAIWLGLIPPCCAWAGMSFFGWRMGLEEPLPFSAGKSFLVACSYYLAMLACFVAAARMLIWMRPTYGSKGGNGDCYALVAVVGTPMMLGSVFHLYPSVALNVVAFVPCFMWSVWLLYLGIDKVLKTSAERGMLMASATLGFILIALATFLAVMSIVWGIGHAV